MRIFDLLINKRQASQKSSWVFIFGFLALWPLMAIGYLPADQMPYFTIGFIWLISMELLGFLFGNKFPEFFWLWPIGVFLGFICINYIGEYAIGQSDLAFQRGFSLA